jgi:hypothetical protein
MKNKKNKKKVGILRRVGGPVLSHLYLAYYIRFLKLKYKWAKRVPLSAVVAWALPVLCWTGSGGVGGST